MNPVGPKEQLMRLLAERLRHAQDARKAAPAQRTVDRPTVRVRNVLNATPVADQAARRLMVSGILAEHFGPHVASDPAFQAVIDEVLRLLEADADARDLLQLAMQEVRQV